MKKAISILLLCCSFLTGIKSQSFTWAQTNSGPSPSGAGPKGFATCVDINGNTFTTGYFADPQAVFGSYTLTNASSSGYDFFVAKYDLNGNLLWVNSWGGTSDDKAYAICTDAVGNVIVAGTFGPASLSIGTFTFANGGNTDMFLAKFDSNGNPLWATIANGGRADGGTSVSCDASGNIYATGYFSSNFLWMGSIILTNTTVSPVSSNADPFIAKYDANGNLLWAKNLLGTGSDYIFSVEVDVAGDVYISGDFISSVFSMGTYTLTKTTPSSDPFLLKLDANGNVIWGTQASGGGAEGFRSMSVDQNSNVYLTGVFQVAPISFGSITLNNLSGIDVFLVKYDAGGNPLWAIQSIGTGTFDVGYSVRNYSDNVFLIGQMSGPSMTFGTYTINRPVNYYPDPMFIAQFDKNGNIIYGTSLTSGGNNCGLALDRNCNAYITSGFKTNPYSAPFVVGTHSLTATSIPSFLLTKFNYACLPTNLNNVISQNKEVAVFPNPTNGMFEISTPGENSIVEIYDVFGKLICKEKIKQNHTIDMSSHATGIYSVVIKDEKGVLVKTTKIIRE